MLWWSAIRTSAAAPTDPSPAPAARAPRPPPATGRALLAWPPAAAGPRRRRQPEHRHRGHRAAVVLAADQVADAPGHRRRGVADRHRQLARRAHPGRDRVEPEHVPGPGAARDVDLPAQAERGRALDRPRQVAGHGGRAGGRVDPLDDVRRARRRLAAEHPDQPAGRAIAAYRTGTGSRAATRKFSPSLVASTSGSSRVPRTPVT